MSLEPSRPTERTRLLSEIQALRAQLRLTHLQNQEKLQQLCAALTGSEARGSQREHQLRRQGGCGSTPILPCEQIQGLSSRHALRGAQVESQDPTPPAGTVGAAGPCWNRSCLWAVDLDNSVVGLNKSVARRSLPCTKSTQI